MNNQKPTRRSTRALSAPHATSSRTQSALPWRAAEISGVRPGGLSTQCFPPLPPAPQTASSTAFSGQAGVSVFSGLGLACCTLHFMGFASTETAEAEPVAAASAMHPLRGSCVSERSRCAFSYILELNRAPSAVIVRVGALLLNRLRGSCVSERSCCAFLRILEWPIMACRTLCRDRACRSAPAVRFCVFLSGLCLESRLL